MAATQIAAATVVKSCAHGERGSAMFLCEQKVDAASSDLPLGGGLPGRHGPDPQSGRMSDPLLGTAGDPIAPRADKRSGRRLRIDHTAGPRHLSGLLGGGGGGYQHIYTMSCVSAPLADRVCACLPIGMNGLKRRNYSQASCSTVKSLSAPCLPAGRSRQGGDPGPVTVYAAFFRILAKT